MEYIMADENKAIYYHYTGVENIPVYLRFESSPLEAVVKDLLIEVGFTHIDSDEFKTHKIDKTGTRILNIVEATARVARQIGVYRESDPYGNESFNPLGGYDVYRYKGMAMMVMGHANTQWHLGVLNIEHEKSYEVLKQVLNRYLGYALAPFGIVGLWGVPVDEGLVVMTSKASKGEAVFIDWKKQSMITQEGPKTIDPFMQVLRLDPVLKGTSVGMKAEELVSYLSTHTTYLSHRGLHRKLKEQLLNMGGELQGIVYPQENFKHRVNLSL